MSDQLDVRTYWLSNVTAKDTMLEQLRRSGKASPRLQQLLDASRAAQHTRPMQAEPDQPEEG
jgi:hypothetical protein